MVVDGVYDTIGGGVDNFVYGYAGVIEGGYETNIHGDYGFSLAAGESTLGGKIVKGAFSADDGKASYAVLIGGTGNTASGNVDGKPNFVSESPSIGVCQDCYTEGISPTIGCGANNLAAGAFYSTVLGGYYNSARADYTTIVGGARNKAFSNFATVVGGYKNKANGRFSTIIGGSSNTINGRFSTAFGYQGKIQADYSAVVSLGSTACEVADDNTLHICAGDVTFNGESVVDLMQSRRRMLEVSESQMKEVDELQKTNAELKQTLQANEEALKNQEMLLARLDAILMQQASERAAVEKRLNAISIRAGLSASNS